MKIVVTGGSGGIGGAFGDKLARRPNVNSITATYNRNRPAVKHPNVTWHQLDLTDEAAVRDWAAETGEIDWLINAAGMLHTSTRVPEKTIRHIDPAFFLKSMIVNSVPTLLLAKHLHTGFRNGRPAIFATVSEKVGSIEDNRLGGWFSYRASKAALIMCIKTLAVEWRRTLPNVAVDALHPGTTDTVLSKPFQHNVPAEQLFTREQSVDFLLKVLDDLKPAQTGRFLTFDGEQLPW